MAEKQMRTLQFGIYMGICFNDCKKYLSSVIQKMKGLAFSLWAMPRQANLTMKQKRT